MKINGQSHYLLATDGSGYYRSEKVVCDCCMIEEHFDENNKLTLKFGHNILAGSIVHPNFRQVIPMCPEPIMRVDGEVKTIRNKQHLEDF
ncbi:MAG: hypothetical protein HOP07_06870 [Bacteriovoracaceae bacterium]|nr:hypothetical protein [Bacteriovoracaceae bacterium]